MNYLEEFKTTKLIVEKVGKYLNNVQIIEIENEIEKDIKLHLDKEVEQLIVKELNSKYNYKFLSEESICDKKIAFNELHWIVDPIDGSMNLYKGLDLCSISIALYQGSSPIFGVVYNFKKNELFAGYVGLGAWLNDVKIIKKEFIPDEKAVLATGIPVGFNYENLLASNLFNRYKKIRMIGSASLSICYVTIGRFDRYYESGIKIWDVAAALAICKSLDIPYVCKYIGEFSTITEVL